MRKHSIFIILLLVGTMAACSKKDRLTANTLTITLEPAAPQSLSAGQNRTFRAICRSAKSGDVDVAPVWSVENGSAVGTFNPVTGKETVFTAGSASSSGRVYASFGDIRSAGVLMTVSGGSGAAPYFIYTDGFATDLAAPGTFSGGTDPVITLLADQSSKSEGTQSFKATFTISGTGWAGWYVEAVSVKNMSTFSGGHLRFDIKTDHDIEIKVRSELLNAGTNMAKVNISNYITPSGSEFRSVSIPIVHFITAEPGLDLSQMRDMFIATAVGSTIGAQTNATFSIDNIRWTSD